jgi:hypothetical protein
VLPPRILVGRPFPFARGVGALQVSGIADYAASYAASYAQSSGLLQNLGSTAQSAVAMGSSIIQNGQPAFDLASTIGSGAAPSQQQVVLGLAAVAGAVNPIAGAVMLAAGEGVEAISTAFQSIFQSLGLYSSPPPSWQYVGLVRLNVDPIPFPPGANGQIDPLWMTFQNALQIPWPGFHNNPVNIGCGNAACTAGPVPYSPNLASQTRDSPYLQLLKDAYLRQGPPTAMTGMILSGHVSGGDPQVYVPGPLPLSPSMVQELNASAPSAFEQFFNVLVVQNLTYWANAQPFIPLRQLLIAAQQLWNASHGGAATLIQPFTLANDQVAGMSFAYASTVSYLLGPNGGLVDAVTPVLRDLPALSINSPDGTNDLNAATSGPSASANAAAVVLDAAPFAAAPAAIALGAIAYSLALGQARDAALKSLWRGVKSRVSRWL